MNLNGKVVGFRKIPPLTDEEIQRAFAVPIAGSDKQQYADKLVHDIEGLLRRKELHTLVTEEFLTDYNMIKFEEKLQILISDGEQKSQRTSIIFRDGLDMYHSVLRSLSLVFFRNPKGSRGSRGQSFLDNRGNVNFS